MKASAWNSSRVTPTITNFLVLMFSMMAPAMAEEVSRTGRSGRSAADRRQLPQRL